MAYNKFITSDGLVLLDLTTDTVTANKLPKGITAHDRSGAPIIGTAEVNSATPIEVSTEAEMTALLTSGEVGGVYKYTGTTGTYENGALYVLEEEAANLITFMINGTSHQAEEGMTWGEWVESEYNTSLYGAISHGDFGHDIGHILSSDGLATEYNAVYDPVTKDIILSDKTIVADRAYMTDTVTALGGK